VRQLSFKGPYTKGGEKRRKNERKERKKEKTKSWDLLLIYDNVSNATRSKCCLNFHNFLSLSCIHAQLPHVVWDSYLAHVSSAEDDDKSSSLEANI
jgi:hypothetical protein